MATLAFVGDCTTTTVLALAATWPVAESGRDAPPVVVEFDPTGGSLAAWLDLPPVPSLSSAVAALHRTSNGTAGREATSTGRWSVVEPMIRRSDSGLRVLTAPTSAREARSAVEEASLGVLPVVAAHAAPILVDTGRPSAPAVHPAYAVADRIVLVHRQHSASPRAAAVRLERAAELAADLSSGDADLVLLVVGGEPFGLDEVGGFVAPGRPAWSLPDDPLAAAVLAGRSGVSARRMARLPLVRAAARVASMLAEPLGASATAGRAAADPIDPAIVAEMSE